MVQPWRRPAASGAADSLPVIPQPLFVCIAQAVFELYTVHLQTTSMQKYVAVVEDVALRAFAQQCRRGVKDCAR